MFLGNILRRTFKLEKDEEVTKMIILAICFFIVLGCYTLLKELKDSVFVLVVGKQYIPNVKIISYFFMVPLAIFYTWLAGKVKRYSLLNFYTTFYGIFGLVLAYFLKDPTIGLLNESASSSRFFGWVFYLFCEGHSPFIVSVLWAFFNSISHPKDIKSSYIFVTVASKLGGAIFSFLAWMFMSGKITFGCNLSSVDSYVAVMAFASACLLIIPFLIRYLIKIVPKENLLGYSDEESRGKKIKESYESGFSLLFKIPYVFGIFGMIFFWETVNVIFNYMRLGIAYEDAESITGFISALYKTIMFSHITGLILALFGTSFVVRRFNEKVSLMLIPLLIGTAILVCMMFKTTNAVVLTYIFIRAVNYSFAYPLRESLYIPTSTSIQFKVKSWIDGFGTKFSKIFGSIYNSLINLIPIAFLGMFQIGFFSAVIFLWTLLAFLLGKRWEKAIKNNEVIGEDV